MGFPPDLFIIGAQKAGTTYLASLLGQNPNICLAHPKEPDYFSRHWEKGEDWYQSCFSEPSSLHLLDASTSYSAVPPSVPPDAPPASPVEKVVERIARTSPQARFIYLLRDPVKRAYSSYWHAVRGGYEHRPFSKAIREDEYLLGMGCYHHQLQRYLRYYERERFRLILFEDFIQAPEHTANQCLEWLGLSPLPHYETKRGTNQTYTYGPFLGRVNRALAPFGGLPRTAKKMQRFVPHSLLRRLRDYFTQKPPPMNERDMAWLAEYYAPHNRALVQEFDLDLSHWTWPDEGN